MKLLIIIVIGGLIVWMFYEMAFKHQGNGNEKEKDDIIRNIDKRDKWYYYKLKLKIFGIFLVLAVIFIIIWLIIRVL